MSREQNVTIFISTHFMNEAERCDRISLMDAGKVLASGTPDELKKSRQANTLEEAFIDYLVEATGNEKTSFDENIEIEPEKPHEESFVFQSPTAFCLCSAGNTGIETGSHPARLRAFRQSFAVFRTGRRDIHGRRRPEIRRP